jgi:hypothetical protein
MALRKESLKIRRPDSVTFGHSARYRFRILPLNPFAADGERIGHISCRI